MELNIYGEICCEICNDVIHTHFDCPECGKDYAPSSLYGSVYDCDVGEKISCEECKATWVIKSLKPYLDFELIKPAAQAARR